MVDIERIKDELNTLLAVNIIAKSMGGTSCQQLDFTTESHGALRVIFGATLWDTSFQVKIRTGKFEHEGVDKILSRALTRQIRMRTDSYR